MRYTLAVRTTEEQRDYDNQRRARRRKILKAALGGACARCGVTTDLDFDHIDPTTKIFAISNGILKPWVVLLAELEKCQLLCRACHLIKSGNEGSFRSVAHGGGISGKKNCPCAPCKARKAQYMKIYKKTRGRLAQWKSAAVTRQRPGDRYLQRLLVPFAVIGRRGSVEPARRVQVP